jgi:hypothetical protein
LTRAWPELLQSNKSPNLLFGEELPKVGWRAHSKSVFFLISILSLFCCQLSTWYRSLAITFHLHGDGVLGAWIFHFLNPFPLWFGSSHFFFNITTPESSSSSSYLNSGKFVMETHDADFCIPKNLFAKNSEQMLLWLYTYL